MKKLILLLLLYGLAAPSLFAQNKAVRDFIHDHRRGEENVALTIPGFLIGLAGEIGMLASEDEDEKLAFSFAQELGTTRILTFDGDDFNTSRDIRELLAALESKHDYERWATVRASSGEQIELSVQMRGKTVRELVAIVNDPSENRAVFVHAKTDFTAAELGDILNKLMAD